MKTVGRLLVVSRVATFVFFLFVPPRRNADGSLGFVDFVFS